MSSCVSPSNSTLEKKVIRIDLSKISSLITAFDDLDYYWMLSGMDKSDSFISMLTAIHSDLYYAILC